MYKIKLDAVAKVSGILKFIFFHPLARKHRLKAFKNFFFWQLSQAASLRLVKKLWVNDILICVKKGMTGITGSLYVGLHEFEDMSFVLHYLNETHLFLDVGANVGCYSLLAASKGSSVIAFEPDYTSVSALNVNRCINDFEKKITVVRAAVGDHVGITNFSEKLDTVNHVLDPTDKNGTQVELVSIDSLNLDNANTVIKIDVEGYEMQVLNGALECLLRQVLVVIVETNNSNLNYGSTNSAIFQKLNNLGFNGFTYEPFSRSLHSVPPERVGNTIFLKDPVKAQEILLRAPSFSLMSENI
jgi:FkbM family methyltransferase